MPDHRGALPLESRFHGSWHSADWSWVPDSSAAAAAATTCRARRSRATVTFDGQPLAQGRIQFEPASPEAKIAAGGEINEGKFSIPRDQGPTPGDYRVMITSAGARTQGADTSPGAEPPSEVVKRSCQDRASPELIPKQYNSKTKLTAKVEAGRPNTFEFALEKVRRSPRPTIMNGEGRFRDKGSRARRSDAARSGLGNGITHDEQRPGFRGRRRRSDQRHRGASACRRAGGRTARLSSGDIPTDRPAGNRPRSLRADRIGRRGGHGPPAHGRPGPAVRLVGTHYKSADPASFEPRVWRSQRLPTVSELEIVGNHEQADGIELEGTMQATITGVSIRRCRFGVHLVKRNRNVLLADSHIYDGRGPSIGVFFDRVNLHQTIITGCHISLCKHAGIKVLGGEIRNLQITGCDIEYNYDPGQPRLGRHLDRCPRGDDSRGDDRLEHDPGQGKPSRGQRADRRGRRATIRRAPDSGRSRATSSWINRSTSGCGTAGA